MVYLPTMSRIVSFGEIMMKLTAPGNQRFSQADQLNILYSGSEANVSAALCRWGMNSAHITRFPDNDLGHAAWSQWTGLGVDMQHVQFGGDRLGLYFVENGGLMRSTRIVYDRLPSAFSGSEPGMYDWGKILEGCDWFHWSGITPALSAGAADALLEAIRTCNARNITVSGDINYRSGLWRYGKTPGEVMEPMIAGSQVIVAGPHDTKNILGIEPTDGDADPFESVSRQLMERFPSVTHVISSSRENITATHNRLMGMLWNGEDLLVSRTYDLDRIVERIGSGDAMIAGFIHGRLTGRDDRHALEFALAAAALKHSIEGDICLASLQEVTEVMEGSAGGKIKR
jgi:2-dehydro-3-deoxygluconokinase